MGKRSAAPRCGHSDAPGGGGLLSVASDAVAPHAMDATQPRRGTFATKTCCCWGGSDHSPVARPGQPATLTGVYAVSVRGSLGAVAPGVALLEAQM